MICLNDRQDHILICIVDKLFYSCGPFVALASTMTKMAPLSQLGLDGLAVYKTV
jgi:hypothetical protein